MTRSAGWAFTFACITVVFSIISGLTISSAIGSATPAEAATIFDVTVITQLALFAAFIISALIAHLHPAGMSRAGRSTLRAGAAVLAVLVLNAAQLMVLSAAGYVVFVLASDVRRWWRARPKKLA